MDFFHADIKNAFEPDSDDVAGNKILACLSYISILFIVPFIFCSKSRFAKYHAKQGLNTFIVFAIAGALVCCAIFLLVWIFSFLPVAGLFIGGLLSFVIAAVCSFAYIITVVIGIINTLRGKTVPPLFLHNLQIIK